MALSLTKVDKAYSLLKEYTGNNQYLLNLKTSALIYKDKTLSDFEMEYIIKNAEFTPIYLNKIIKIAEWYGKKKQEDWEIEFTPKVLKVGYYLGETKDFYHMFVQYRQSVQKMKPIFIPKTALLTPLFLEDYEALQVDFDKYNEKSGLTLKDHQERAIKFLLSRKKAILALQMGFGKSMSAIVASLEGDYKKVLVVCPASIKTNWRNELSRFVNEDEITIVEGSKWKENRYTIINYDILDNFYEIPTETIKVKEKVYNEDGTIKYEEKAKKRVSRKSDVINEAMNNSQLFQSNFDLIIIDEAHKLSNSTSGRYKIISDLIKRSNPKGIFELTGTMVTNNPQNLYNILKLIDADVTKDWADYMKKYCGAKQIFRNRKERDYYTNIFLKKKNKQTWYDLTYPEKDELNQYLEKTCKKIWIMGEAANLDELSERIKHLYYRETSTDALKSIKKTTEVKEYTLTEIERQTYQNAWQEYLDSHEEQDLDKILQNHKLIEGSVLRQITANIMIPHSIELAEQENEKGNKVIIFCAFDNELYTLQEHFGDKCVIYNGKMTAKKKDKALKDFTENDDITVFIGNLDSASVGLNIIAANVVIFNNISFLPAVNMQSEFRILRLGQTKPCTIYYQKLKDTYMERMFEILDIKNNIIDAIVKDEDEK